MADTTPVETAPVAPSNEPSNTPVPPVDNSSADVEAAKKEAEQATMRANQLQNELAKIKADQEAAKLKQLEEKEEYKTLYEKTQSQLNEIEESKKAADRNAELATATSDMLKDYPENVQKIAQTAGLALSDDSEAAKTVLKEKLEALKTEVGTSTPVVPNNPHNPAPEQVSREELVTKDKNGISPMALAGARGDDSVVRKYIGEHPAIKQMKRNAGLQVD